MISIEEAMPLINEQAERRMLDVRKYVGKGKDWARVFVNDRDGRRVGMLLWDEGEVAMTICAGIPYYKKEMNELWEIWKQTECVQSSHEDSTMTRLPHANQIETALARETMLEPGLVNGELRWVRVSKPIREPSEPYVDEHPDILLAPEVIRLKAVVAAQRRAIKLAWIGFGACFAAEALRVFL